jgi:lipopolysaccharide/colanic/teichoic acid biosynthesis glycosyltransferase
MNPVLQERVLRPETSLASSGHHMQTALTVVYGGTETTEDTNRSRRILNTAVATIALIILAPVMFAIALVIIVSSNGPVLYTQTRVGINRRRANSTDGRRRVDFGGRLFKIYKFRTMFVGSDGEGEVWARPDDPRVTPFGRILRKYRLDELPQLFNVLKGDMNLVGPRPEQPKIFSTLRGQIDDYAERQRVLPGITGLAQVRQHYDRSIEDVRRKVMLDLQYISSCSWHKDLKLLCQTLPVVIFQRGAW